MDSIQREVLNWYMQNKTPENREFKEDVRRKYLASNPPSPERELYPSDRDILGADDRFQFNRELDDVRDYRQSWVQRQAPRSGDWSPLPGQIPDPTEPVQATPPSLLVGRRGKQPKVRKPEERLLWDLIPTNLNPGEEAFIRDQLRSALKEQGLMQARQLLSKQLEAMGLGPSDALREPSIPLPAYASQKAAAKEQRAENAKRRLDQKRIRQREKMTLGLNKQQMAERAAEERRAAQAAKEQRRVQAALDKQKAAAKRDEYRQLKDDRAIIKAANKGLENEPWGFRMKKLFPDPADQMRTAKQFVRVARDRGLPFAMKMLEAEEARQRK